MRPFRSKPATIGRSRSAQLARRFGRDLRVARITAGMTQAQLARLEEVARQEVSLAELGDVRVSLSVRCRLSAACGHELGWRLYPVSSIRLRDSGQLSIAQRIVAQVSPAWSVQLEAPIADGDPRAADIVLASTEELIQVEIERVIADAQAQLRSAQLKRQALALAERDVQPVRLVIAVPNTRANRSRHAPYGDLLGKSFPAPSRRIWRALRGGLPVGADGILYLPMARTSAAGETDAEPVRS